jgi:hypothetical protein
MNTVVIFVFDIRGLFGLGKFFDLYSMAWCLAIGDFCSLTQIFTFFLFHRALHFHV